jgi:hypothetical protein
MQDHVDRDWQLIIKGQELLDRAHAVARKIEKRVRKVWRSFPPDAPVGKRKRNRQA